MAATIRLSQQHSCSFVGLPLSGQATLKSATERVAINAPIATFGDTNASDAASDFTATITWGDGTTTIGTVSGANGSFAVAGTHTYADEGSFASSVEITRITDNTAVTLAGTVTVA